MMDGGFSLGLGLGLGLRSQSAIAYDSDAQARFTAVEGAGYTYVAGAKTILSDMIAGLKTDSVWTKLADIHVLAGVNEVAGVLMPLKTSVGGLTSITATGFTQSDYIASGPDCGINDYENTRFIGSPGSITAKSMHIGAVAPAAVSGYGIFGFDRHNGNLLQPATGSFPLLYQATIAQIGAGLYGFGGTDFIQQNGRSGHDVFMNRSSTSAMAAYVNGASVGTASGASVSAPGSGNMFLMILGASNVQCGGRSRAAYWIAAGISNAEGVLIRNRIATALAALGRITGITTRVFEGDSLTYGTGVGVTPYSDYLEVMSGWGGRNVNVAYNSETVATGLTQYATHVRPFRPDSVYSTQGVLFVWYGTNELNNGIAATTIQTDLNTYWAGGIADGYVVIAFTILPRTDAAWSGADETQRQALNTSIRAASANYDSLIDIAAFDGTNGTPNFSNPDSTTYYLSDKLHLNSAGEEALANWIFANFNPDGSPIVVVSESQLLIEGGTDALLIEGGPDALLLEA